MGHASQPSEFGSLLLFLDKQVAVQPKDPIWTGRAAWRSFLDGTEGPLSSLSQIALTMEILSANVKYLIENVVSAPRFLFLCHTLYTIHYTLYTIHYTLYTIHYTLYTIHYTLYTMQRITEVRKSLWLIFFFFFFFFFCCCLQKLTKCKVCRKKNTEEFLLLCDTCGSGYHTFCLSPPLRAVPRGEWSGFYPPPTDLSSF